MKQTFKTEWTEWWLGFETLNELNISMHYLNSNILLGQWVSKMFDTFSVKLFGSFLNSYIYKIEVLGLFWPQIRMWL